MKIENTKLAIQRIKELQNLDEQLSGLSKLKAKPEEKLSLYINEWSDGSGISVAPIYRDGNFIPGFYHDIINTVIQRFEAYREKLVAEIESL